MPDPKQFLHQTVHDPKYCNGKGIYWMPLLFHIKQTLLNDIKWINIVGDKWVILSTKNSLLHIRFKLICQIILCTY